MLQPAITAQPWDGAGVPGAHLAYREPPPARIAAIPASPLDMKPSGCPCPEGWPRVMADLKTLLETGDVPAG